MKTRNIFSLLKNNKILLKIAQDPRRIIKGGKQQNKTKLVSPLARGRGR